MKVIKSTGLVWDSIPENFRPAVSAAIKKLQEDGQEVTVQYQHSNECFSALITGTVEEDNTKVLFKRQEFTKSDLKNFMIVKTKDNNYYLVANGVLCGLNRFIILDSYDDTLHSVGVNSHDIVSVYKTGMNCAGISNMADTINTYATKDNLIFERN